MPFVIFGVLALVAGSALFGKGCTVSAGVTAPPPTTPPPGAGDGWGIIEWGAAAGVGYLIYKVASRR